MKLLCVLAPSGETLLALDDGDSPVPVVLGQFTPSKQSAAIVSELVLMYNNQHAVDLPPNVFAFQKKGETNGAKDA